MRVPERPAVEGLERPDGRDLYGYRHPRTPVGNRLDVLNITPDGSSATRTTVSLPMPAGRFRSVVQAPDGSMYVATDQGDIYQLKPM